ncbi:Putative exported protein [Enterobacter hormaechei]|nr:Putative exported protein [Enterobacter hormaechei]
MAVVNPTPTPLTHNELNDLLDYGNWRMNHSQCSLDPNRREVRVTALTDDKALMIISCEAGAYNTVDLAWLVSRKKPFAARSVRLRLPFTPSSQSSDMELMNASFDEKNARADHAGAGTRDWRLWDPDPLAFLTASASVWYATRKSQAVITGMGQMPGPRCGSQGRVLPICRPGQAQPPPGNADRTTARSAPSPLRSQR